MKPMDAKVRATLNDEIATLVTRRDEMNAYIKKNAQKMADDVDFMMLVQQSTAMGTLISVLKTRARLDDIKKRQLAEKAKAAKAEAEASDGEQEGGAE